MKIILRRPWFLVICLAFSFCLAGFYAQAPLQWRLITTKNEPLVRSENSFAQVGDKLYLLGGRNKLAVEAFDIKTQTWEKVSEAPLEIHHFQAITFKDEIYVLG